MTVSPEEMHYVVSKLPAFQDAQGKFDPEAYKRNIEAQRMSVAEYEQGLADSILRDKVMAHRGRAAPGPPVTKPASTMISSPSSARWSTCTCPLPTLPLR